MTIKRAELNALLATLERALGKGFSEALKGMTTGIQFATLTRAVRSGDLDKIMHAAGMRAGSWNHLTEQIRTAYIEGGAFTIASEVPARFGMVFDVSNRRAQKWLRQQSSQLITRINKDQRNAIQLVLKDGMRLGKNPRSMGLDIVGRMGKGGIRTGGIIGLNVPQTRAVMNMRTDLRNLDPNYFTRARRDRRFDKVVHRAIKTGKPLSTASVSRLTSRYSDRLKELRGATIGRTEALASLNAASHESMEQVIGEGLAPKKAIKRIWHHGGYSKDERKGHKAMGKELQERDMDEAFINPYTNQSMMYPGAGVASEVINCRCWVEHKVDFVQVETGKAAPALPGLKLIESIEDTKKAVAALRAARLAKTAVREAAAKAARKAAKKKADEVAKTAEKNKKKSFNPGGEEPNHLGWVNTWRKKGTFDTPRLKKLVTNISDPKQIKALKEGAHYSRKKRGINMTHHTAYTVYDKAVMRHEWGHFFDDQLGLILKADKHYLKVRLKKLAGDKVLGGFRYLSGQSRPIKALAADAKKLEKLGARVYKKNKDFLKSKPGKGTEVSNYGDELYTHRIIEEGWSARKYHFADLYKSNEMVDLAKIPARALLNSSDNIIAKIYREIKKKGGHLGPWDELLLADAVAANDLSILFYRDCDFLKMFLEKPGFTSIQGANGNLAMLTDLLGAMNGERTLGGWASGTSGHGIDYYSKHWSLHVRGTEAFANMTAMETMRATNKLFDELVRTLAPKYSKWFDDVLDLLNAQL